MADFVAKSDFRTPYQAKRLFFFGGLLARGLKNRFGKDFGPDLSIDMGFWKSTTTSVVLLESYGFYQSNRLFL